MSGADTGGPAQFVPVEVRQTGTGGGPTLLGIDSCCCEQLNKGFYVLTDPVEDLGKAEFVPVH